MYRKCPSQRPQQKAEKNRVCLLTVIAVRHADGKGNVVPLFVGWCTDGSFVNALYLASPVFTITG